MTDGDLKTAMQVNSPHDKFMQSLNSIVEEDMLSIKIHMMIENALDDVLAKLSVHPDNIPSLQFPVKLGLIQAFHLTPPDSETWKIIKSFNAFRNSVAHAKEHEKKEQKYLDLERMFLASKPSYKEEFSKLTTAHRLIFMGSHILGFLYSAAHSAKIMREYIAEDRGLYAHLMQNPPEV